MLAHRRPSIPARRPDRRDSRQAGQSLLELGLVLPVFLLLLLFGIDFGRIYLGYVELQQMARVAGTFAATNASAWVPTTDPVKQQDNDKVKLRYKNLVLSETQTLNCELPQDANGKAVVPDPIFSTGVSIGDPVQIDITCKFGVITPIIGNIVGKQLQVTAQGTFPVTEGAVSTVPGGGGTAVVPAPVADFTGTPRSGFAPLSVTFTDTSTNNPTSWIWDFGDTTIGLVKSPPAITYPCAGTPGTVCHYTVQLTVQNSGGSNTTTKVDYITVTVPPATGPIAEFTATPKSGRAPLAVNFAFVETRTPPLTYSRYDWDFNSDGTVDFTSTTTGSATFTYPAQGTYDVTLKVTEAGTGATNSQTKLGLIVVGAQLCTVPDFANKKRDAALGLWTGAGFTGTLTTLPPKNGGNANYNIKTQTITGGTIDPQPNGCASTITVGP